MFKKYKAKKLKAKSAQIKSLMQPIKIELKNMTFYPDDYRAKYCFDKRYERYQYLEEKLAEINYKLNLIEVRGV